MGAPVGVRKIYSSVPLLLSAKYSNEFDYCR